MLDGIRLVNLSKPAKVLVTAFLALVGVGYLVGVRNIFEHHADADLKPGLTLDDLRRHYHGMETQVTEESRPRPASVMERMVGPGGPMRKFLEKGGPTAVRSLTTWLQRGAEESTFTQPGLAEPGDPSAQRVIGRQCVHCHNATDGENRDVPYAPSVLDEPEYALVKVEATPLGPAPQARTSTMYLAPIGRAELVQVTHAHIMAIPVFTLIVAALFLLTGLPNRIKAVVAPAPMLLLCADFASWWLARIAEPFIYVIAAAGALFALTYGAQILCVFCSLWFGKRTDGVQRAA